jgi:hypothetical protein
LKPGEHRDLSSPQPQEINMSEDQMRGFMASLYKLNPICSHCWRKPPIVEKLQRCSRCHLMSYCSKECQRADWQAHHKDECCNQNAPLRPEREDPYKLTLKRYDDPNEMEQYRVGEVTGVDMRSGNLSVGSGVVYAPGGKQYVSNEEGRLVETLDSKLNRRMEALV